MSAGAVAASQAGYTARSRRQVVFTMGGLMLTLFLSSLDQTVVSTAMPRIIADLGGFDRFTWVTTAYLVASTTAVPIVGRLSDLYGRKMFFLGGIVVFLLGSILAGVSQSMNQLIVFRAIQGIGGGSIMALSFTTVGDLFSPAERGKYQGVVAAVFGLSSVIGPTLGGFITDNLSWHWVFYVNVPLGLPIIALFIRFFPNIRPAQRTRRLDYAGMALLVLVVVPLLVGLSLGGVQFEWLSLQIVGILAFAAVMTVAFVFVERRAENPVMPLSIYANRVVSISLIAVFITGFGMFGSIIFIPLFFQGVLGASATSSGSFLTPMMLSMVVAATLSGQALSRLGGHYRIQGLVGIAVMTAGIALTSRVTAETSFGQAVAGIVVTGLGLGVTFPKLHDRRAERGCAQPAWRRDLRDSVLSLRGRRLGPGGAWIVYGEPVRRRTTGVAAAGDQGGAAGGPARPHGEEPAGAGQSRGPGRAAGKLRGPRSAGRGDRGTAPCDAARDAGLSHWRRVRGRGGGAGHCVRRDDLSEGSSAQGAQLQGGSQKNLSPADPERSPSDRQRAACSTLGACPTDSLTTTSPKTLRGPRQ